jgi:hypothetical protein
VINSILDEEILYRCVFYGRNLYTKKDDLIILSSQAFADRNRAPSVDRAIFRDHNPELTKKSPEDGVVSLITKSIRELNISQNKKLGKLECLEYKYKIDVVYCPEDDNSAHSQIEAYPDYKNDTSFRKVRERLAFLANQRPWEVLPYEFR